MVIEAYDTSYTVVYRKETTQNADVFICKKNEDTKSYLVFCLKSRELASACAGYLYSQVKNREFDDFCDCFMQEAQLYVVFRYYEAPFFQTICKEEKTDLRERLEIGRKLLEKILLLKMPLYFRCFCLEHNGVLVETSGEVCFSYSLEGIAGWKKFGWRKYLSILADWMRELLEPESEKGIKLPVFSFIAELEEGCLKHDQEVYQRYLELVRRTEELSAKELEKPDSIWFRLWEHIKSWYQPLKKIAAILILLLAFLYVSYAIWQTGQPKGEKKNIYEYIGTVNIEK